MVVRRSAKAQQQQQQQQQPAQQNQSVRLMERLVKKSLAVNPNLSGGKGFAEAYADLREQVTRTEDDDGFSNLPAAKSDRRARMANFFFREKDEELAELMAAIEEREQALAREKASLKKTTLQEALEFVSLVAGRDEVTLRKIVQEHRQFWARLGVSPNDVLERARKGSS